MDSGGTSCLRDRKCASARDFLSLICVSVTEKNSFRRFLHCSSADSLACVMSLSNDSISSAVVARWARSKALFWCR